MTKSNTLQYYRENYNNQTISCSQALDDIGKEEIPFNRKKHLAGRDLLQLAGDCREGIVVITPNIQALV